MPVRLYSVPTTGSSSFLSTLRPLRISCPLSPKSTNSSSLQQKCKENLSQTLYSLFKKEIRIDTNFWRVWATFIFYSQSKSSVHDKLHELHSHFPPIAQKTPSIITSSCWKSTLSNITASSIDRKKGHVQNVSLTIRNLYDYKTKEYVDVLTSQSSSLWFQHQNLLYLLLSYKSLLFWTHYWLTGQMKLWRSEHASFSIIQDDLTSLTVLFQQLDVIIKGVLWAIGRKWECSSWSLSCTNDLLWL